MPILRQHPDLLAAAQRTDRQFDQRGGALGRQGRLDHIADAQRRDAGACLLGDIERQRVFHRHHHLGQQAVVFQRRQHAPHFATAMLAIRPGLAREQYRRALAITGVGREPLHVGLRQIEAHPEAVGGHQRQQVGEGIEVAAFADQTLADQAVVGGANLGAGQIELGLIAAGAGAFHGGLGRLELRLAQHQRFLGRRQIATEGLVFRGGADLLALFRGEAGFCRGEIRLGLTQCQLIIQLIETGQQLVLADFAAGLDAFGEGRQLTADARGDRGLAIGDHAAEALKRRGVGGMADRDHLDRGRRCLAGGTLRRTGAMIHPPGGQRDRQRENDQRQQAHPDQAPRGGCGVAGRGGRRGRRRWRLRAMVHADSERKVTGLMRSRLLASRFGVGQSGRWIMAMKGRRMGG